MEMKYNSLKEALPSLLEEATSVSRRIQQLETQIAEMDGIIENLEAQREDLDKKSSLKETQLARVKQIISVKEIQ